MVPAEFTKLSTVTIRGWFWQEVDKLDKITPMDEYVGWFTTSTKGKSGGTLASLDDSLKECVTQGKRTRAVDGSLRAVIERGFAKIRPIKSLLIQLSYELDRRFPTLLPVVPTSVRSQLPCSETTLNQLNSMVRFGALNVTYFATTPPAARLTEIKNRSWAILQDPDLEQSIAKASAPVQFKCGPIQFKEMAEGVLAARGGVCTTFAATAVHLLLNDGALMSTNPRIEFVSGPKHCLCLVNRASDPKDVIADRCDTIVSCGAWNDDVVIIDPWAASMGYHAISSKTTYPACLKSMIGSTVVRYFDSNS